MRLAASVFAMLVFLMSAPTAGAAPPQVVTIRGGVVLEGPRHTLKDGGIAGWSLEFPRARWSPGFEISYAWHRGIGSGVSLGSLSSRSPMHVLQVGPAFRRDLTAGRSHPYLGAAVELTYVQWGGAGLFARSVNRECLGGWLGAGWSMPVSARLGARLDVRYHPIVLRTPDLEGAGNFGDFFTVGLSLAAGDQGTRVEHATGPPVVPE